MHKLSTVNNQDSSGKVVKALGAYCGGPWFESRLVLGCFLGGRFSCNFDHTSGTNAHSSVLSSVDCCRCASTSASTTSSVISPIFVSDFSLSNIGSSAASLLLAVPDN